MQIDGLTKWIWVFAADPLLFEKMDAKKAGIISKGNFSHFFEGNLEYLELELCELCELELFSLQSHSSSSDTTIFLYKLTA